MCTELYAIYYTHECFASSLCAKVSCRDTIRQARVTRVKTSGVKALSNVKLGRSESGAHHVFRRYGQAPEIKISKTDLPSKPGFPYVSLKDWLHHVIENDLLEQLVGVRDINQMRDLLRTFWERYKKIDPAHVAFSRGKDFPLDMLIPVLHHGDEGRGLKKKQIMVLSTHGMLGKGSHKSNTGKVAKDVSTDPLKLNMLGNTYLTHFLFCVMPVSLYNATPEAFYHMLDLQAKEFSELFHEGIIINNIRFYICCMGIKGDAPYIAKSGKFDRAFTRRPTRATSKTPCAGICHLCLAGRENFTYPVPFEQIGVERPVWEATIGIVKPYTNPSPLLQIPYQVGGTTEELWKFDLFHNVHSGMGKYFASSAIVVCLELIQASIEESFNQITIDFKAYCQRNRESPYHKKLTQSLFGVEGGIKECPEAGWSKGDFTRLILKWFGDWCSRCVIGKTSDPLYITCVS